MSENKDHVEKKKSGFSAFMEGTGGLAALIVSIVAAIACIAFSGIRSYGIIKEEATKDDIVLDENADYNSEEDVAAYIYRYGHLPENYITKQEAQAVGWIGGSVQDVAPGKSIGGDRFYDDYYVGDGLARAEGRYYTECDVNTDDKDDRGAERIVFSNDGLVYYSPDHYVTFDLLYGQEVLDEFY